MLKRIFFFILLHLTSIRSNSYEQNPSIRRAEEYVMTSASIDGIKRSNVCGDGYRIEGALLKSYPYTNRDSYLPYENCYMTFKARRADQQIRIRILSLDLNDIHAGVDCLDSLRFYQSAYTNRKDKLNTIECGKLTEEEGFSQISPTGIVTAHFSTDGGNVSGTGFKVVLTAFRYPNKTHPCDEVNEEFLCQSRECISSLLLCDNVPHCLDGSDEIPQRPCNNPEALLSDSHLRMNTTRRSHWRGILIVGFLLIIFIVFLFYMIYTICRRFFLPPPMPLINGERKNYATMINSPLNKAKSSMSASTHVVFHNDKRSSKRLDDDYNLL